MVHTEETKEQLKVVSTVTNAVLGKKLFLHYVVIPMMVLHEIYYLKLMITQFLRQIMLRKKSFGF